MEWITIGIVIGVALWTYLNMPKIPKVTQKPGEVQAPICEDGAPIPVVFGTVCIKGANVTTWGGVSTKPIPEGQTKGQLLYYLTMRMCLCHGKIDGILKVLISEKLATLAPIYSDQKIYLNALSITSTQDGDVGSVIGNVNFRMGAHNATIGPHSGVWSKPSEINGETDGKGPGFFGIACVELENVMVGGSPYLAPWAFVVQRINLRNDWQTYGSVPQWYLEKAVIPHGITGETPWLTEHGDNEDSPGPDKDAWLAARVPDNEDWKGPYFAPFYEGTAPTGLPSMGADGFLNIWPAGQHIWAKTIVYTDPADFAMFGKAYLFVYAENAAWVWIDGQYVGATNPDNSNGLTLGVNFDVTDKIKASGFHTIVIYAIDETQHDHPHSTYLYARVVTSPIVDNNVDAATLNSYVDMNPAHIVRECLTDPVWGMGYLPEDVDDDSFEAAADQLYLERFGISIQWNKPSSIEDFLNEILRHINGTLYVDRLTGKYKLTLVREGYDESTLLHLDESSIEKLESVSRRATGDLINQVSVSYTSSMMGEEATVTVTEPGLVQSQGAVISHKIDYPGITTHDLASRVALRDLKALSSPSLSCTVVANRKAASLNPGDPFVVTWPECGLNNTVMRVAAIELGDGRTNAVKIKCVEDVFGSPDHNVVSAGDTPWKNPTSTPVTTPDPVTEDKYNYASTFMVGSLADKLLKQAVVTVLQGGQPVLLSQGLVSMGWTQIRTGVWQYFARGKLSSNLTGGIEPYDGMRLFVGGNDGFEVPGKDPIAYPEVDKPHTGIYILDDCGLRWDESLRTFIGTYPMLSRASDASTSDSFINGCVIPIGGGIPNDSSLPPYAKFVRLTTTPPIVLGTTALNWEFLDTYSSPRGDYLFTADQAMRQGDGVGNSFNLSATASDPGTWITFPTLAGTPNAQTYPAGRTRFKFLCALAAGDTSATTKIECQIVRYNAADNIVVLAEAESDPIVGDGISERTTHVDVDTDQALSGARLATRYRVVTTSTSQVVVNFMFGESSYRTRVDTPLVIGAAPDGFDHTPYGPVIVIGSDGILKIPNIDECSGTIRVSGSVLKGIDTTGFVGGDKLKIRFTEACTVYQNQTVRSGSAALNLSTMGGLSGDDLNIALGARSSVELQFDDLVNSWEAASPPVVM